MRKPLCSVLRWLQNSKGIIVSGFEMSVASEGDTMLGGDPRGNGCLPWGSVSIKTVSETTSWRAIQSLLLNLHFKNVTESHLEMECFYLVVLMQTHAHKTINSSRRQGIVLLFPAWHRMFRNFPVVKLGWYMPVSLTWEGENRDSGYGLVDRTRRMGLHVVPSLLGGV